MNKTNKIALIIAVLFIFSAFIYIFLNINTTMFKSPAIQTAEAAEDTIENSISGDSILSDKTALDSADPELLFPHETITATDETFSDVYDEIYSNRDMYYGREIDISGFVFFQKKGDTVDFLVGRDLVWCCDTDKYFIGFLVITDSPYPDEDTAVRITGKIEPAEYINPENGNRFMVPAIAAETISPAGDIARRVFPWI